jgi:hypothetical protein
MFWLKEVLVLKQAFSWVLCFVSMRNFSLNQQQVKLQQMIALGQSLLQCSSAV